MIVVFAVLKQTTATEYKAGCRCYKINTNRSVLFIFGYWVLRDRILVSYPRLSATTRR